MAADNIDFGGLEPRKTKPTKKQRARYRRWVKYLKDSSLCEEEIYRRARHYTNQRRELSFD